MSNPPPSCRIRVDRGQGEYGRRFVGDAAVVRTGRCQRGRLARRRASALPTTGALAPPLHAVHHARPSAHPRDHYAVVAGCSLPRCHCVAPRFYDDRDVGARLHLLQKTVAVATSFFHRFFAAYARVHGGGGAGAGAGAGGAARPPPMPFFRAACCVFLACKVAERRQRRVRDVMNALWCAAHGVAEPMPVPDANYWKLKEAMVDGEQTLLRYLRFDCAGASAGVDEAYRVLLAALAGLRAPLPVQALAWTLLGDAYLSPALACGPGGAGSSAGSAGGAGGAGRAFAAPEVVACAAVRLAIEFLVHTRHCPAQMRRLAALNRLRWWESLLGTDGSTRLSMACHMILEELDDLQCFGDGDGGGDGQEGKR